MFDLEFKLFTAKLTEKGSEREERMLYNDRKLTVKLKSIKENKRGKIKKSQRMEERREKKSFVLMIGLSRERKKRREGK